MKLGKLHIHAHHLPHIAAGMITCVLLLGFAGPVAISRPVNAELLPLRSVQLSDPTVAATNVKYKFGFSTATTGLLGAIRFEICSNYIYDPNVTVCTPPPGLDASGITLTTQTGVTDFNIDPASTSNVILITRPLPTAVTPQPLVYEFSGITNPSSLQSWFVRISTYDNTSGSGPETDYGTVVATTVNTVSITTEVPPYLYFCTGVTISGLSCDTAEGSLISFGELSTKSTRSATSQLLASTNADYGYSVTMDGTTMMAGNNVIPAMSGQGSEIGTSQFGLNARLNNGPNVGEDPAGPGVVMPKVPYGTPNSYRFNRGDIIAASDQPDDYRKMTVSYIVNRAADQPPGRYVATISYICLANF